MAHNRRTSFMNVPLPINHASLKSDNITYVKMSYVLAILKHLAKAKYCQKSYSAKNILYLRKVSRKKTLAIQRDKQNKMYDSGKRSKKYQEEKQKKAKLPKNTNSNIVAQVDMVGTNHNEVLTLLRHMSMCQFCANIFLIQLTSTYFLASEVFKNQSF